MKLINFPHIVSGAFPLSDLSLMTDEERATFLPATRTFVSVLEKENLDPNEIEELLRQSDKLSRLIPAQFRNRITEVVEGFIPPLKAA